MKPPSKNVSASLRGQRISTSGPGPTERGSMKSGASSGTWPGQRTSGAQPPGGRCDNAATVFADAIKKTGAA